MSTAEVEFEEINASPLSVLETQTRGEIDIQIATAKKWPRSIKQFRQSAMEMATLDEETAGACIYALPRDGKTIEGPSARLAEIIFCAWGNARAGARTVSDEGNFVTAQGAFHDLERNVAISFEVRRRIVNKKGNRYSDDMVGTTANAACSIALRNAVLKGIPKAFWQPIYDAAKKTAIGKAETLVNRRTAMLAYFQKMGVTNDKVFALLGVKGADDITLDHMFTLKGLATAIKEGDTTVDDVFAGSDSKVPKTTTAKEMMQEEPKAEESQLPPTEPEDVSQEAPAEPVKTDKKANGKKEAEKFGEASIAWPKLKEQMDRVGNNATLEAKEKLGWLNTPFQKLSTHQILMLATELAKINVESDPEPDRP